jgi:hypothetical protein
VKRFGDLKPLSFVLPQLGRAPRVRTLKGGIIAFPNGISTIACKIRDQSATGALLIVEPGCIVPDEFMLIFSGEGHKVPCNVAWRKPGRIGVKFVAALSDRRHHTGSAPPVIAAAPPAGAPEPVAPAEVPPASREVRSRLLKKPIQL